MLPHDQIMEEAFKCSGCGFCLSACPVYRILGIETLASRGRMDTVRGMLLGELKLSPRMEQILSTCLMCQACESSCPPGAAVHKVILEGRHRAVQEKGLPWPKRLAFRRLLKNRGALARALSLVRKIQRPSSEEGNPGLRHLPTLFSGLSGKRALPPIAKKPLRERFAEVVSPPPGVAVRGRVGFFCGCYMDFVETTVGDAALRVLSREGFEVFFPREQVCCGAPAFYSGDLEGTLEIALLNGKAFSRMDLDAVLVTCATCGSGLAEGYQIAAQHLQGKDRAVVQALSLKTQDLSKFLIAQGLRQRLSLPEPLIVTYHDPCHHVRGQKISRQPRDLLLSVENITLKEMAEPARCCGGGGSFSLSNPEISVEIGRWKVQDILSTEAQAVVTSCPGCILQIQEVAQREGAAFQVLHLVELLDLAAEKNT